MNPQIRYVGARLIQAVVVVFLSYVLVFVTVTILPGNPIESQLSNPENSYTASQVQQITEYYELDKPVLAQLVTALGKFISGNFGYSLASGLPVKTIIGSALPSTLTLAAVAMAFVLILAIAIGFGAVFLPRKWGGNLLRVFPSVFLSIPNFAIGLLIIEFLSFKLNAFTLSDQNGLYAAIFPAIALAIPVSAQVTQVLITGLDTVRQQPFVTVSIAKGLNPVTIFFRHLLKLSSVPVVTVLALTIGEVLGGSVITEAVFARTGLGSVVESAVLSQDVPVIQAVVTLSAVVFVVVNLVTDLVYPLLDPRLRSKRGSAGLAPTPQEVSI